MTKIKYIGDADFIQIGELTFKKDEIVTVSEDHPSHEMLVNNPTFSADDKVWLPEGQKPSIREGFGGTKKAPAKKPAPKTSKKSVHVEEDGSETEIKDYQTKGDK